MGEAMMIELATIPGEAKQFIGPVQGMWSPSFSQLPFYTQLDSVMNVR